MKQVLLIGIFTLVLNLEVTAQLYKSVIGTVSFFSEAPLENIAASSSKLHSILNVGTSEIVFTVPISSFEFKKSLMKQHFNEHYLESDQYHDASYKGSINDKIDWKKDGTYKITSSGTLTIHGVPKARTDTALVTMKDGKISLQGYFWVKVADHQIKIPKIVFKNIAETVLVKFNMVYIMSDQK